MFCFWDARFLYGMPYAGLGFLLQLRADEIFFQRFRRMIRR
ncbi:hypothetical protein C882_3180 [Caenispirillum salinarum AK4]|uniref:Uncharacterized protein n=1 Tax=Caenispirillum salinarum AK4 TaxID=1238182 RepID=K9HV50_9PROT|nr:hypothetical protein C882_3180 [Caenispirillum salinarum AK4]